MTIRRVAELDDSQAPLGMLGDRSGLTKRKTPGQRRPVEALSPGAVVPDQTASDQRQFYPHLSETIRQQAIFVRVSG